MQELKAVRFAREGAIARLTFERPDQLNALSPTLISEALQVTQEVAGTDARVLIVTGAGKAFSAGVDMKAASSPDYTREVAQRFSEEARALAKLFETMPQPVIAMVRGYCFTGGLELALGCDLIVASDDAQFCDTHGKLGLRPGWGLSQRLPRRIGAMRARAMSYTGQRIDAPTALAWGLILAHTPGDGLEARVNAMAEQIAGMHPEAVSIYKELLSGLGEHRAGRGAGARAGLPPAALEEGPDPGQPSEDVMSHGLADLRLPVMAAPMTLASSLELILACCRAGVIGGFQAANAGPPEIFAEWLGAVQAAEAQARAAGQRFAPYIVNLLAKAGRDEGAHRARLDLCRASKTPLILTTAGDPSAIVEEAHDWGGRVFHDVTTIKHIEKAVAAGVDGLMLVAAGSGGHSGALNPFAFVAQARRMFDGVIVLAGGITDGRGVAAALTMGADIACMGTRFIASKESGAPDAYRQMLIDSGTDEVLYTDALAGLPANFMKRSIVENGLDPDNLPRPKALFHPDLPPGVRPWRTLWSAGHSVGMIDDAPSVAEVVERLTREFEQYVPGDAWRTRLEQALAAPMRARA